MQNGITSLYDTNSLISTALNMFRDDFIEYLIDMYGCESISKNDRMHFTDYEMAVKCRDELSDIIPKAVETGNLFLP